MPPAFLILAAFASAEPVHPATQAFRRFVKNFGFSDADIAAIESPRGVPQHRDAI